MHFQSLDSVAKCFLGEALAGVVAKKNLRTSWMAANTLVRAQVRPLAASRGVLHGVPPEEIALPVAENEATKQCKGDLGGSTSWQVGGRWSAND